MQRLIKPCCNLVIVFLSILLASCQISSPSQEITTTLTASQSAKTPLPPNSTSTRTSRTSPSSTPKVDQPNLTTPTPNVIVTPTPADGQSSSIEQSEGGIPPVTLPSTNSLISLKVPDPKLLVDVLSYLFILEDQSSSELNEIERDIHFTNTSSLAELVQNDINRYYPQGLPGASGLLDGSLKVDWSFWMPPEAVKNILAAGTIQYINDHQVDLDKPLVRIPKIEIRPTVLELDGDSEIEYLLEVRSEIYNLTTWIPVDVDISESYSIIPNDLVYENEVRSFDIQIYTEHDLTGDGLSEVVIINYLYAMGSMFGYADIYTWNGDGLFNILSHPLYLHLNYRDIDITWEILDQDGDGRDELIITTPQYGNFGCQWNEVMTFRWNEAHPYFTEKGTEKPNNPFCNIDSALDYDSDLSAQQRARLLENAISQISLSEIPSPDFMTLMQIHLAMMYAAQGNDNQAERQLALVNQVENGEVFTMIVQETLETSKGSPIKFCDLLYGMVYRQGVLSTSEYLSIHDYISSSTALGLYPSDGSEYPPLVCPLPYLINHRLDLLNIPIDKDPSTAFIEAELSLTLLETINLDDDSDLEWIGILELTEPQLLILEKDGSRWQIENPVRLGGSVTEVELLAKDATGDGATDLLVLSTLAYPVPHWSFSFCGSEDGQATEIMILDGGDAGFELIWGDYGCGDHPPIEVVFNPENLESMLSETANQTDPINKINDPEAVGWFFPTELLLSSEENQPDGLLGFLDEITENVLVGNQFLQVRGDIMAAIKVLPEDDPFANLLRERLLFIKGLSYELEGIDNLAIETYLELIQLKPNSPWSWLAFSRLEFGSVGETG